MAARKNPPKRPKDFYRGERWKPGEMRAYLKHLTANSDPRNW